jgi:hypothetical protein
VEPQRPSSSTPPPPPAAPPPQADGGSSTASAVPEAPLPNVDVVICPVCREPRAEGARFCEECGHDYGGEAPVPAEDRPLLSGPVLWAFMVFWAALAIGALIFLYNMIWVI